MTAGKYFPKIIFQCKCVLFFLFLFIFNSSTKEMPGGGNGRSGTAVFSENLVVICTHDKRLWMWIWIWMANFISTSMLTAALHPIAKLACSSCA